MFLKVEKVTDSVARDCGFRSLNQMIEELRAPIIDWYLVDYGAEEESLPEAFTPVEIIIFSFMTAGPRMKGYRVYTEKCTGWISPDRTHAYVTEDCAGKVM